MIPVLIAAFLAALGLIFSGNGGNPRGSQSSQANPPITGQPPNKPTNPPPGGQPPNKPPTPIPTPVLLPGLIGLGVATLRKRKAEKDEANV